MYYDEDEMDEAILDRSKTDYYCKICQASMNSLNMWNDHVNGKRHLKNLKKQGGEIPSKVKNIKVEGERATVQDLLDKCPHPLLGLSYITERRPGISGVDCTYHCHLCQGSIQKTQIIDHVTSTKHRLLFFKHRDPPTHQLMDSMKHLSKSCIDALVEDHANQWEMHHERELVQVEFRKLSSWPLPKNFPKVEPKPKPINPNMIPLGQRPSSTCTAATDTASGSSLTASDVPSCSSSQDMEEDVEVNTLQYIKNNFKKFPIEEKIKTVKELLGSLSYATPEDRADNLEIYLALCKIFMLEKLRMLPQNLQHQAHLDLGDSQITTNDVLRDILMGKKSYYFMEKPIEYMRKE